MMQLLSDATAVPQLPNGLLQWAITVVIATASATLAVVKIASYWSPWVDRMFSSKKKKQQERERRMEAGEITSCPFADGAGNDLAAIRDALQKATHLVGEVAEASKTQMKSVDALSKIVGDMQFERKVEAEVKRRMQGNHNGR